MYLFYFICLGDRGIDGLNGLPGRPGLKGEPGLLYYSEMNT